MQGVSADQRIYQNPQATVHVTVGTSGAFINEKFMPQPAWSAVRNGTLFEWTYGFMTMKTSQNRLDFEFLR